jgi:hypothetical protein
MSRSYEDILNRDGDRLAVGVGVVATMVFAVFFLFLPFLVPLETLKQAYFEATGNWVFGNPFNDLRLFGGLVAGFVTGYLTKGRWYRSVTNGVKAVGYGVVALYCLVVLYYLYKAVTVWGTIPLFQMIINPLILGLPIGIAYVFGGFFGSLVGHGVRDLLKGPEQSAGSG